MTVRRTPLMDVSNNNVASSPAVADTRRKSGRAVRAPDKFVPVLASSPVSSKRKRGWAQIQNDAPDTDEESDSSELEEESLDEEELRASRRKTKKTRKPAVKKPKTNDDMAPAVQLPNRPKKPVGRRVALADKDAGGLYADVFFSGETSEIVATKWLHRYMKSNHEAFAELINLVLRSAGCTSEITGDDVEDVDNVEGRLGDLQDEFQSQNITDYPLISKAKSSNAFRTNLVGFFNHLINVMHESKVLYEEVALVENIHQWISTMSSSTTRPFRHTATLVALIMTSARCRIAHDEIEIAAKVQRQLESEAKNKRPNKARLADFQSRIEANSEKKRIIEDQIQDFFDTVYVHRYRDIDPRIRTECVTALGDWILTLESYFFDGQYLRYMGWMLSDPRGTMRQEVIKQLHRILKSLNPGGMRHFIERFRPRLIEMAARDSEPGVRAQTIELLNLIRDAEMLEPDDIDVIGKLIFDSDIRVRKSVIQFFANNIKDIYDLKIDELGGSEALDDILNMADEEDYDSPRASWIQYKCLAETLVGYDAEDQEEMPSQIDAGGYLNVLGNESRFSLASQVLFEKMPELKQWEALAGYLLYDHSARATGNETERAFKESVKPTEREELVLLEVLNSVVKLNLQHIEESGKGDRRKQAQTDKLEARETAARHLASLIPRLLKKYSADPRTVTVVLRLEHILNLTVFQELRQDSTVYAKLLDEISTQFSSHADRGVLKEAGTALLHARGYNELEEVTDDKIQSLWEDTINMLQKINKAGQISVRAALNNKLLTDLSHNLARLEQLSSISDSVEFVEADSGNGDPAPISLVLDVIARGEFEDGNDDDLDALEDETVQSAVRSAMFYFMWKTRAISQIIAVGNKPHDFEIDQLRNRQETFITNLIVSISSRNSLDSVRLLNAGTLLDLHVLFATLKSTKTTKNPKGKNSQATGAIDSGDYIYLQSLIKEITPEVQKELTSIFDSLEKLFAKRSKRKLREPDDDEAPEDMDSEPEDEDNYDISDRDRQAETLKSEQELCELTGKFVLAILAHVIDASGPLKGKLQSRIQRNRQRLGPNFKEVVGYLDEPKVKSKKSNRSKTPAQAAARKPASKSALLVVEEQEEEEDDAFAEEAEQVEGADEAEDAEEVVESEDLKEDDPEAAGSENGHAAEAEPNSDDDELMGD